MDYSHYQQVKVSQQGRVLTLTLSNPAALNAVTARMHTELSTIFYDVALNDSVDVVVLTGADGAFCAGGDIGWMRSIIEAGLGMSETAIEGRRIVYSLLDLEKPLVCRLNGDAVGLGATLALFSDIIVADETARIGDPHVRVGLVAGDGGAVIWPQLIGYARAKEMLMLGDLISGADAARIGLVNKAVPAEALDAEVNKLVEKLLRGSQRAIRWTKLSLNIGLKQIADAVLDASLGYEVTTSLLPDHKEAVDAFHEKRRPEFGKR